MTATLVGMEIIVVRVHAVPPLATMVHAMRKTVTLATYVSVIMVGLVTIAAGVLVTHNLVATMEIVVKLKTLKMALCVHVILVGLATIAALVHVPHDLVVAMEFVRKLKALALATCVTVLVGGVGHSAMYIHAN